MWLATDVGRKWEGSIAMSTQNYTESSRTATLSAPAKDELAVLHELFEEAPVAYHEIDADGVILRVNAEECRLLGYSAAEILGRYVWEFVEGAESEASRRAIAAKVAGTLPLAPFRRTLIGEGNRTILVEIRDRLIRDSAGQVTGIRSALIDITVPAAQQAAEREDRRWLHAVLHSYADPVLVLDTLGVVLYSNPPGDRLLESVRSAAEARNAHDSPHSADPILAAMPGENFIDFLQSSFLGTVNLAGETGRPQPYTLRTSPVVDEVGLVIGIVVVLGQTAEAPVYAEPTGKLTAESVT